MGGEQARASQQPLQTNSFFLPSEGNPLASLGGGGGVVEEGSGRTPPYLKGELRPYQIEGVNWLIGLFDAGLNGILPGGLSPLDSAPIPCFFLR